ncbi:hypothetical protein H0E84_15210 [Luteimonas sp. SJ-92]|uniref:Uncharacterized protein n=1 Tax=Luteimonas salinisoli TaxID=2752307 RepID=A0A853JH30_9GAMM|nr:hypothetical protein [Luteimonas salinisoli]NZA27728.1 hypothetical protein [Luteimonas salinisoli]
MLDKARSNVFSIFMRKIGFSVGLEHTLDRLIDFSRMYSEKDTLSYGDISRLLHEKRPIGWGLDPSNEHILDVLRSLGIVDVRKGEVAVLEAGDALGILSRTIPDDAEFRACATLVFGHSLLLADGDVFLNALASGFDVDEFSTRIASSIEHKWSVLEHYFASDQHRRLLYSAVNIEAQTSNPGSRGRRSLSQSPDLDRLNSIRPPLSAAVARPETAVTSAYLNKALPRRKAWAVSLGLVDSSGAITDRGTRLLESMMSAGYAGPGCFSLWPLQHEISSHVFSKIRSGAFPVLNSWEFLVLVGRGLDLLPSVYSNDEQRDEVFELLERIMHVYKALNQSKSIVRTELPARVAYRCIAGYATISRFLPDLPKVVEQEQLLPSPRIVARQSRIAESALSTHK